MDENSKELQTIFRRSRFLQPPASLFCADRLENRPVETSGYGANANVCELLRPQGKAAGRKPDHRHSALQGQERRHGRDDAAGREQPNFRGALPDSVTEQGATEKSA